MPTALITGSSSGIGAEFARQLAGRSWDLILVARRRNQLETLASDLEARHGVGVEIIEADLTRADDLQRIELRVANDVEMLINNAGRGVGKSFLNSERDEQENTLLLNVVALHQLTHAALNAMAGRGRGDILNVSSIATDTPNSADPTYAATKAFVTTLGQGVHYEAKKHGVNVTTLMPGFVHTEMTSSTTVPSWAWIDIETLVREALADLAAHKVLSVPTLRYKVTTHLLQTLPRSLVRYLSARSGLGSTD